MRIVCTHLITWELLYGRILMKFGLDIMTYGVTADTTVGRTSVTDDQSREAGWYHYWWESVRAHYGHDDITRDVRLYAVTN
jgi:hypothetical protein